MVILDDSPTTTSPLDAYAVAQKVALDTRQALLGRLAAIKTEKKETFGRLNAEAKQIRAALGRVRKPKAERTPRTRKPKPTAPIEK